MHVCLSVWPDIHVCIHIRSDPDYGLFRYSVCVCVCVSALNPCVYMTLYVFVCACACVGVNECMPVTVCIYVHSRLCVCVCVYYTQFRVSDTKFLRNALIAFHCECLL